MALGDAYMFRILGKERKAVRFLIIRYLPGGKKTVFLIFSHSSLILVFPSLTLSMFLFIQLHIHSFIHPPIHYLT